MSVGGVGGGGGGGGGASAASSAGRGGGGGGPSGAGKGGPSGAGKGGPSGASKGGPSGTSAKSTGSVGKGPSSSSTPNSTSVDKGATAKNTTSTSNTTSTERSAAEQAKDAERQRAQSEIQSDKFQRNGAPTTSGDVVKNMMQSQGINAGTSASSAVVPGSNGSDAATAAPAASGAGATTSDAGLAETTAANDAADAQVKQETKETAGREAIRNAAGNGMDMVGNAYQAYGDGQGKAASREFKGKVATVGSRIVGDALQRTGEFGARVGTAIRDAGAYVGDKLSGWADKAAAKWQSGKGIGSAVGGLALRGTGAVFSVGGDIIQSGMPKSFAEGGALVTKNIISGGAATFGAIGGGFLGGPPGAVGGAVLAGGAVDGVAGRIADSIWGTNRYDSGPSVPADVQFPNDWNVAP